MTVPSRFALLIALLPCLVWAGEADVVTPRLQPRVGVLAKLNALGANSSILFKGTQVYEKERLDSFAVGQHKMQVTGPRSRNFSLKMAWMADRERAFFTGANHGSPGRFNGAWEFDLPSLTWVMLYVPDYDDFGPVTDNAVENLVLEKGWLRTKNGGSGHPGHTWWGLTYDTKRRAVLWYNAWPPYRLNEKLEMLGKTRKDLYKGPPLWLFYPESRTWAPLKTAKPWPRPNAYGASLDYFPQIEQSVLVYKSSSWLLDVEEKSWREQPAGLKMPIETLFAYDSHRQLYVGHRGPHKREKNAVTWHMELADGLPTRWRQVLSQSGLPDGHDAKSFMYYDPVGRVVLLYEVYQQALWSYNPDRREWRKLKPDGPVPEFDEKERVVGYMDTARNVFVVIGYDTVWCYRYMARDDLAR